MKRIPVTIIILAASLIMTSAFGLASASASGLAADEYPAGVNGKSTNRLMLTHGGYTYGCIFDLMATHINEGASGGPTQSLDADIEGNCIRPNGGEDVYESRGCGFIYHFGEETNPGEFKGTFDIGPADCGPIVVDLPGSIPCDPLEIPPQTGLSATYINQGSGATASVEIETDTNLTLLPSPPPYTCGSSGRLAGSWTLTGENEENKSIGIRVNQTGVFMSGEESESEAAQPQFDAEVDPEATVLSLFGSQDPEGTHKFGRATRTFTCTEVDYEGEIALGLLMLDTEYSGCTSSIKGSVAEIEAACPYVFSVFNVGPPYAGGLALECGETPLKIEVWLSQTSHDEGKAPACKYEFAQQKAVPGVGYSTVGEGNERGINIDLGVKELVSTRTAGLGLVCGPLVENTSYSGSATVFGVS
jgi:hypothetical protein